MVHRYWRIALLSPAVGFLLGAVVIGLVYLAGNPWARTHQTLENFVVAVLSVGTIGLVVGIAALLGGFVVVACIDRQLAKSSGTRTALAAVGAAGGVLLLGIVFATVQGVLAVGWASLIIGLSVALAIAAGVVAAILVYWAERKSQRIRPERVEHPLPSAWVDF